MRTLIDLTEGDLKRLADIADRRGISRAAVVREAVREYLDSNGRLAAEKAFGLWSNGEDGLEYQDRMRGEW